MLSRARSPLLSRLLSTRRVRLPEGPTFADFVQSSAPPSSSVDEHDFQSSPRPSLKTEKAYLTDTFGRFHNYLRISLTERCNLRCTYCMPAEGVPLSEEASLLTTREIGRLASVFAQMGVTKVRLTGGEPTLRRDLAEICEAISSLPGIESVGMTTNGVVLGKEMKKLYDAGMRSVNVSLDSVRPETFEKLTRRPAKTIARVMDGIRLAETLPGLKVKINCVVMRGSNSDQLAEFVRYFLLEEKAKVDVRFIEWMPFNANEWNQEVLVSASEIVKLLEDDGLRVTPLAPDDPHDTTRWFQIDDCVGSRVGIISSMTQHFCGGCNRVRLTADGALKTCLFGDDALSLRDLMRQGHDDQHLADAINNALQRKHFAHGGKGEDGPASIAKHSDQNRPMILIGG
mmetsp:Transcript_8637/g.28291  ORF Transcript_8637/g.28291 Transcript_8637/m.28291 type:complete len:400 (-) Transcript_8637:354-1553(-)